MDGSLLLTFHIGIETRHPDTWFDQPVQLDFHFFEIEEMKSYLQSAGWHTEEVTSRELYRQEVATRRA